MSNVVQFPVIAGVEITTDSQGRFNLNALHRASGGEKKNGPSYWLALDSTKSLIAELDSRKGDTGISVSALNVLKGGTLQGTFAHELLAVSYASWISPAFQLKVNQVFIDYRTGKLQQPAIPQSLPEALRLAAELAEERDRLLPKGEFYDQCVASEEAITVAKAAKILGTGSVRLFAFLRRIGWVTRRNEPYQSKIEAGYLDVKLSTWNHPENGLQQSVTTVITGKGLAKLQQLYKEHNQAA